MPTAVGTYDGKAEVMAMTLEEEQALGEQLTRLEETTALLNESTAELVGDLRELVDELRAYVKGVGK